MGSAADSGNKFLQSGRRHLDSVTFLVKVDTQLGKAATWTVPTDIPARKAVLTHAESLLTVFSLAPWPSFTEVRNNFRR